MFEHPYLFQQVTAHEQEQIERTLARRRMIAEHADQIVPREAGPVRRALRRLTTGRPAGRTVRGGQHVCTGETATAR